MREADFREWLGKRRWKGAPLEKKAKDNRFRRSVRAERGLKGLGFAQETLEAVHADGQWETLLTRLAELKEPGADPAAVQSVVPQAEEPSGQLTNMIAALKQYGHFLEGHDPNYGAVEGEEEPFDTREALACLEQMVAAGQLSRVTGRERRTKAVIYLAEGGRSIGLELGNGRLDVVEEEGSSFRYRPTKDAIFPAKVVLVFQRSPYGKAFIWRALGEIDGLSLRDVETQLKSSAYASPEARLQVGTQQVVDINTRAGFDAVLALYAGLKSQTLADPSETVSQQEQDQQAMPEPTNLILYGPPGTGKTYATAREAVMLCDGFAPEDRAKLMTRYRELREDKRIEFVTFHQNFSYEDFVEGLRPPVSGVSEAEDSAVQGGLRLEVHLGIFRDLSQRAALDRGEAAAIALNPQKSIFKIALGARGVEEDQISEALDNSEITLGWGGQQDWSDSQYDEFSAILSHWQSEHNPQATGKDPNVEQITALRSWMQEGDYVVVSDGRDRIRAIGEVTGPYSFHHNVDRHPHRRKVRWLWRNDAGLDRDVFYPKGFRRHSLYRLDPAAIDWTALANIVDGDSAMPMNAALPRPHVLIIDEINRANISKVFGELITLIEPDKRLGKANALTVRLPYSKREFGVPANLHIVGTMNTADRSIALLDTALRRRFRFQEIAPRPELLPENIAGVPLRRVLAAINQRIEYLIDRDHRIGHAFFMGEGAAEDSGTRAGIDAVMRDKVIPLLQEYFFEDWSRIAAVVGRGFIKETALQPPPGLEGLDAKPSWSVRETFPANAFDVLLGKAPAPAEEAEVAEDEGEPETDAA